jgi:hypothetical protein
MSKLGWSYPAGCSGTPYDDAVDPSELQENVMGVLEDAGSPTEINDLVDLIIEIYESKISPADPNEIIRDLIGELLKNFNPTPEHVNSLPQPLRKYIHDLETIADPAGIVRENSQLKDQIRSLEIKLEELSDGESKG